MTENEILQRSECWQTNTQELIELSSHVVELISDQQRPELCSLSLSGSVRSESTVDLDTIDQCETFYSINNTQPHSKIDIIPMENNFTDEKTNESVSENKESKEMSVTESAKNINKTFNKKFRKCMSLHDVSSVLPLQLAEKSVNTVSCETIHSQSLSSTTKSKDSGFQRSVSCLSLTSGKRNYDHVQSKVKAYIRNIKESEALRKKNKVSIQQTEVISEPTSIVEEIDTLLNKEDLLLQIQELKHELHEKALYIDVQQRNYNSLLLKFAAAKNTIDALRIQAISLDYGSVNESRNLSAKFDSFDFDVFEKEMKRKSKSRDHGTNLIADLSSCKETPLKEQLSSSLETPNTSLTECFRPRKHSTPDRNGASKNLSPVSKIFSSSSRLDKHYKPLSNLNKIEHQSNCSTSIRNINSNMDCSLRCCRKSKLSSPDRVKSKQNVSKLNDAASSSYQQQPVKIDVPNDDPFDKVKKWQASLPSIDLLGNQSSSDCEMSESWSPSKKPDAHSGTRTSPDNQETEVNCLLSRALVTKCRISEMDVDSDNVLCRVDRNMNTNSLKHNERLAQTSVNLNSSKSNKNQVISPVFGNSNLPNEKQKIDDCKTKCLSCTVEPQSHRECKHSTFNSVFKSQRTSFPVPIKLKESSVSENETQTYLPKSTSLSQKVGKVLKGHSSSSDDDSSSVSSSVLESNASLSVTSPTRNPKRRSAVGETNMSSKVPKLTRSQTTQTSVLLREPKLNVVPPVTNQTRVETEKCPQIKGTIYNTWFGYRNANQSINVCPKTESSQRKAWNDRNKVNFSVCKDFHFQKSNLLIECLEEAQQMCAFGYSLTETILDRNIH